MIENMMLTHILPAFAFILYLYPSWTTAATLLIVFFILSINRRLYICLKMLPRDIRTVARMSRIINSTKAYRSRDMTLVDAFREQLQKSPNKVCFIFGDKTFTLHEVEDYSNKIANIFSAEGYKKGDSIALMVTNRPEYVCSWLGLAKLGVVTALLNTSVRDISLTHCLKAANVKGIIFSEDLKEAVLDTCKDKLALYQFDGENSDENVKCLQHKIKDASSAPPVVKEKFSCRDNIMYIYTSGTTGLPKPAVLPNLRYILGTMGMFHLLKLKDSDIVYNPLPLYHTAGGVLGAGVALTRGVTVVLRNKFSASSYLPDCIKYNCTVGQYIGEMCRYILAVPPRADDKSHKLRCMIGNGLRPAIWEMFVERFNIPNITEFYGSTEGNTNMANLDSKVGAVGSLPQFVPSFLHPVGVIRMDNHNEEPIRDSDGLCIRCQPGETGMFVGLITSSDPTREFAGYADKVESNKKVIHDVFKKGDSAFVSGDLMEIDDFGYIYFKDRTGDTFRWKGENVATSEVEAVISSVAGLRDCTVYGVPVGDYEGKAGMAAVVDSDGSLDLEALRKGLEKSLPPYARPLFLRVLPSIELTGTFKLKKLHLQAEGFDPDSVPPPARLFFRKPDGFVPLTKELYQGIIEGSVKL